MKFPVKDITSLFVVLINIFFLNDGCDTHIIHILYLLTFDQIRESRKILRIAPTTCFGGSNSLLAEPGIFKVLYDHSESKEP